MKKPFMITREIATNKDGEIIENSFKFRYLYGDQKIGRLKVDIYGCYDLIDSESRWLDFCGEFKHDVSTFDEWKKLVEEVTEQKIEWEKVDKYINKKKGYCFG